MQRWRSIRAGLIALAIVIGLVDGCPLPVRVPAWQRGFVEPLRDVQRIALTPVAPIGERFRLSQRWALYQSPSTERYRLWIEGRAGADWRVLFRAGDPAHQEDAALIDYTRPRGTWDRVGFLPQQYPLFADWVMGRMLARHPELDTMRVKLERVHLSADGVAPTGEFIEVRTRMRGVKMP